MYNKKYVYVILQFKTEDEIDNKEEQMELEIDPDDPSWNLTKNFLFPEIALTTPVNSTHHRDTTWDPGGGGTPGVYDSCDTGG